MRKGIILLLTAALLLGAAPAAGAEEEPALSARCAVLTGPEGQLLYERNARERRPMASTTKLMTALVVAESCAPDELVEIPAPCCAVEGSSMELHPGERLSVEELLTGLLLVSGNDAAEALAIHCSGSVEAFAQRMNEKAQALGMADSHFVNPHGLSAENHYSTAADLAVLMAACMDEPRLEKLLGMSSATLGERCLSNHNKLLWRCPGCLGGKTGYTQAAGRCLVSCCEREGARLYCVTLDAPDDWNEQIALYEWGFARYGLRELTGTLRASLPVPGGRKEQVELAAEELRLFLPLELEIDYKWELPPFVLPPVHAGQSCGRVCVLADGEELGWAALRFSETVLPAGEKERGT